MIDWAERTASAKETNRLAARLAGEVEAGTTILLYGELGAGKTEFVRGFVAALDPRVRVSSPTFTLANTYPTEPPVYHLDLYRTSSLADLADLGLDEYLGSDGIVLIEWAEKCETLKLNNFVSVRIKILSDSKREFKIKAAGNADTIG